MNVKYSEELATRICELLASDNSERAISEMEGMPSRETMRLWREMHPEFLAKCACARLDQAHSIVSDMADIEDGMLKPITDATRIDPQAGKAALSSKQWRASKLNTDYSDRNKTDLNVTGEIKVIIQKFGGDA